MLSADDIKKKGAFPPGFDRLPHVKHAVGGMVFPQVQIKEFPRLERFDVDFDLPECLLPEFPPPIFLTTHPELGDVSQGEVLHAENFDRLFRGLVTPAQLDGLRMLVTQFAQEEFNATHDRKTVKPSLGVTCLDCHVNFHTTGQFHLNPDTRPQMDRLRLDTVSLRGMFNQQIHGSKRNPVRGGFHRIRAAHGVFQRRSHSGDEKRHEHHRPGAGGPHGADAEHDRFSAGAEAQSHDRPSGPWKATELEAKGEELFLEKRKCAACHQPPAFTDHQMHDLHLERFGAAADGPIKTFVLRGIKDSPPYFHDGRLPTLEDTVEFFNVVGGLKLEQDEKRALAAFLRAL